jgi:hypothetical protein
MIQTNSDSMAAAEKYMCQESLIFVRQQMPIIIPLLCCHTVQWCSTAGDPNTYEYYLDSMARPTPGSLLPNEHNAGTFLVFTSFTSLTAAPSTL